MTTPENTNPELLAAQLSEAELQIRDLQEENDKLQQAMEELTSERDRILIENKLAIEDAELVRSFKRTNYAPLIEEMFEKPAKRLRRQTLLMVFLAIIGSLATAYLVSGYLLLQNKQAMETELTRLHSNLDLLQGEQSANNTASAEAIEASPTPADNGTVASTSAVAASEENEESTTTAPQEAANANEAAATPEPQATEPEAQTAAETVATESSPPAQGPTPAEQAKAEQIATQADSIVRFIQSVEQRKDFPQEYRTDKSKMTQLYMIVTQQAGDQNLYYQAYIEAMERLGADDSIRPQTVSDMADIDRDFLHALLSAYLVTDAKQAKGWRYRDLDRRFSTYYNNTSPYQLGAWQIVNKSQDYSVLPKVFAVNIQRVQKQLAFNGQLVDTAFPDNIFYLAYNEANKNNAVKNLFNNDSLINKDGVLNLNIAQYPLPLKREAIYKVQEALAKQGFIDANIINGTAGPKTAAAVKAYQQKNNLRNTGEITLALAKSLNVGIGYSDLAVDAALDQ